MKKLICILVLCLALVGCSGDAQGSSDETVTTTAAVSDSPPKPVEKMGITAEVLSYEKEILTFKYEGQQFSLPFFIDDFDNDWNTGDHPSLAENIINNKYGITVYAKMSVAKDMSQIFKCDVTTPNGQMYYGEYPYAIDEDGKDYVVRDKLYSFRRKEGTLCEISNNNESLEFDLNDLPMFFRADYPETIDPVKFDCYKFNDGQMLLCTLCFEVTVIEVETDSEKAGVSGRLNEMLLNRFGKRLCFFGAVQSVGESGKTVTVLLNDKKTLCTVPTYYSDGGELKEGMEIMVALIADSSLFGSGGEHEFDYAVIYTDPEYYNQTGEGNPYSFATLYERRGQSVPTELTIERMDFDELAYAEFESWSHFSYTRVSDLEEEPKVSIGFMCAAVGVGVLCLVSAVFFVRVLFRKRKEK